jgi:hypothetical protein
MIEKMNITGKVCFDHFINPAYRTRLGYVWLFKQDYEGYKFPEEKPKVIELVKQGLDVDESLYMPAEDLVEKSL